MWKDLHLWNADRRGGNVPFDCLPHPSVEASYFGRSKGLCSLYSSRIPLPEVTSASSVLAWWGFFFISMYFIPTSWCFFFNSSIVDLQCCVSFRCTAKWFSYTNTCDLTSWLFLRVMRPQRKGPVRCLISCYVAVVWHSAWSMCSCMLHHFIRVWFLATPWTIAP